MGRIWLGGVVFALAACGGSESADWLDQWDEIERTEEHDGQTVGVDDDGSMIYVEDCDLAERLTAEGGPFGPSERDPDTLEYEPGYGSICP